MRLSPLLVASLLGLSPVLGCASSDPKPTDPNQYANNPGGQYGQPGQPGQYGQPGQPGQYPQPGQTGQYSQPGQTGQYQQPGQTGQYQQPGQTGQYQPAPGATAAPAPAAGGFPGIPGFPGFGQPASSGGSSATPIAFAAALTPAIQMLAASEAPGMSPEGQSFAGQFQEGQTLEQPLTIQAGKCYTVVAASAGTVQQLDIQLIAQQAPLPAVVLAQGTGSSSATLGGKSSGCFRNSLPINGPGVVILKATHGGGIAGAQIFVK